MGKPLTPGERVRVARCGRRIASGHVPKMGCIGVLVGYYPDDPAGYVYAVHFDEPKPGGMTLAYQIDEVERA